MYVPPEKLAVPKESGSGKLGSALNAPASSAPNGDVLMRLKKACSATRRASARANRSSAALPSAPPRGGSSTAAQARGPHRGDGVDRGLALVVRGHALRRAVGEHARVHDGEAHAVLPVARLHGALQALGRRVAAAVHGERLLDAHEVAGQGRQRVGRRALSLRAWSALRGPCARERCCRARGAAARGRRRSAPPHRLRRPAGSSGAP